MSSRTVATIITILVLLGVLALMLRSWRRRSKRDAALPAGYPQPAERGRELASAAALYVATTPRDQPLERLAIPGLGFRARGGVSVTAAGVLLELAGSPALFIPADAVELVTDATWAIDRAVEPGGLFLLGWRLAPAGADAAPSSVDSYFRFSDPADRTAISAAITSLAVRAPGTPNGSTASGSTEFGTEESEV
ncbi:PH-like domain-containing protein [Cryobacterium sp. AP23]